MIDKERVKRLRDYKRLMDSDDVRHKEIIKKKLLDNEDIIYVLNNKELQEKDAPPDEYYGVNILPYYMISPTQTNVQNFICYEVAYEDIVLYKSVIKRAHVTFYILCEQKNLIDKETGIARHDLLAALLMEEFNWKNYFGTQAKCISDEPSVVDTSYAARTLVFEMDLPNNIVKSKNNKAYIVNSDDTR